MAHRLDLLALFMGIAFAFIWSSAFSSSRIIVLEAPPMTALAVRFAISGAIGVGLALLLGGSFNLTRSQWRATILFGICQNVIYLGFNFIAMQWIEASLAAIIASSLPLIVAFLNRLLANERLGTLGTLGLAAGFVGVALVMGGRLSGGSSLAGILLCVVAAIALAVATLTIRSAFTRSNLLMVVGIQMLVGSAILSVPAVLLETPSVDWSWRFGAAFAYTIIFPGLLATWLWFTLVNRTGPTRASSFHFLNPFFGVAVAGVLLGERFTLLDIVGVAVVTAGILAVQLARERPPQPTG